MQNNPTPFTIGNSEYLTFNIGKEEYGIDILKVKEIQAYQTVTKIANTAPYIIGIINLRGTIVPIVDLRIKFNLRDVNYDGYTVVIVLTILGRDIGIVVDGVLDVVYLPTDHIHIAPKLGPNEDLQYFAGVGTLDDRMIILTDIEHLLSASDMALFAFSGELT